MTEEISLQTDEPAQRSTLVIDSRLVAYVEYYVFGHVAIITHTEVDDHHEGQGLGTEIARQTLDRFERAGYQVVPVCGFFAEQIRRHAQYWHLLTPYCRRIYAV